MSGRTARAGILLEAKDRISPVLGAVGASAKRLGMDFAKLETLSLGITAALAGIPLIAAGVAAAFTAIVGGVAANEFQEVQDALDRLDAVLRANGGSAKEVAEKLKTVKDNLGTDFLKAISDNGGAMAQLSLVSGDTAVKLGDLAEELEKEGWGDTASNFDALASAVTNTDVGKIKDLATSMGMVSTDGKTGAEVLDWIRKTLDKTDPSPSQRMADSIKEIGEMTIPMGIIGDLLLRGGATIMEWVKGFLEFVGLIGSILLTLSEVTGVLALLKIAWDLIVIVLEALILEPLKAIWHTIEDTFLRVKDLLNKFKEWLAPLQGAKDLVKSIGEFLDNWPAKLGAWVTSLKDKVLPIWESIKSVVASIGTLISDMTTHGVKVAINFALGILGTFIDKINALISGTPLIGSSLPQIPSVKLLEYAKGGVVPGPIGAPVPALVHGGETIIPSGGQIVVQLMVDRFRLGEVVVDIMNREARFKANLTSASVSTA